MPCGNWHPHFRLPAQLNRPAVYNGEIFLVAGRNYWNLQFFSKQIEIALKFFCVHTNTMTEETTRHFLSFFRKLPKNMENAANVFNRTGTSAKETVFYVHENFDDFLATLRDGLSTYDEESNETK